MFLRKLSLSDGFSVTELLIALALAAILLALAAPNFRSFLVNNRTKTQADSFLMMMYQARSEALKRNVSVSVSPIDAAAGGASNEWGMGARIWVDVNNDGSFVAADDTLIAEVSGLAGSHTLDSSGNNELLVFDSSGRANVFDNFHLCGLSSEGIGREIYVSTTGRLGISEYSCN